MKRNENYVLRSIAQENILVPTGELSQSINGLITLNEMASFIWNHVNDCQNVDDMVKFILAEYDVDEKKAREDTEMFLKILLEQKMIEM